VTDELPVSAAVRPPARRPPVIRPAVWRQPVIRPPARRPPARRPPARRPPARRPPVCRQPRVRLRLGAGLLHRLGACSAGQPAGQRGRISRANRSPSWRRRWPR